VRIKLDVDTPEFREALEGLADTLQLPHNESSEAMVRACAAVLEQKISAAARARAETAKVARKGRQQSAPKKFTLQDFPPGFDTGDEQLNKVCVRAPRRALLESRLLIPNPESLTREPCVGCCSAPAALRLRFAEATRRGQHPHCCHAGRQVRHPTPVLAWLGLRHNLGTRACARAQTNSKAVLHARRTDAADAS
jgi:hypothetical protein